MACREGLRVCAVERRGVDRGISNERMFAMPTKPEDMKTTGYLTGRYAPKTLNIGVEGVEVRTGANAFFCGCGDDHN